MFWFCPISIIFLITKRHVILAPDQKPNRQKIETEKKSLEMSISSLKLSDVSVEEKSKVQCNNPRPSKRNLKTSKSIRIAPKEEPWWISAQQQQQSREPNLRNMFRSICVKQEAKLEDEKDGITNEISDPP